MGANAPTVHVSLVQGNEDVDAQMVLPPKDVNQLLESHTELGNELDLPFHRVATDLAASGDFQRKLPRHFAPCRVRTCGY